MAHNSSEDLLTDSDEEAMAQMDIEEFCASSSTDCIDETSDTAPKKRCSPAKKYRPKYLIVSDFARQIWCEQQLLYHLDPDLYLARAPPGETVTVEEKEEVKEIKQKGTNIHLQRELEVQVPVEVTVTCEEDAWAVKVLNLQAAVLGFHRGQTVAREVPVFGSPFGFGIMVYGIIDEISYDPVTHSLTISELKTRKSAYPPKPAQTRKDALQVQIYSHLFNDLVCGSVSKTLLADHLRLRMDFPLGEGVCEFVEELSGSETDSKPTLSSV